MNADFTRQLRHIPDPGNERRKRQELMGIKFFILPYRIVRRRGLGRD